MLDGNRVDKNNFDVTRAYINVTGKLSHIVSFRVTADINRESGFSDACHAGTPSPTTASCIESSMRTRQFNLDDWMTRRILGAVWHPANTVG